MTVAAQKLVKQVLALPERERAKVVRLLNQSLPEEAETLSPKEWERVWKIELEKRIEDIRTGKVKTVPAKQVMAKLRAKYG